MPIKSFRGLMVTGAQDTIALHTNDGSTGYRIVKFELMNNVNGTQIYENTVKIYKVEQSTVDAIVDFSENTMLAAAFTSGGSSTNYPEDLSVIFDNEIFNQDIYVTNSDTSASGASVNYYIELEQIKLDLNQNTTATLKDIRNETLVV